MNLERGGGIFLNGMLVNLLEVKTGTSIGGGGREDQGGIEKRGVR